MHKAQLRYHCAKFDDNNNNNNGRLSRPLSGEPGVLRLEYKLNTQMHAHTQIGSVCPVNHGGHTRATNEKLKDK